MNTNFRFWVKQFIAHFLSPHSAIIIYEMYFYDILQKGIKGQKKKQ